MPCTVVITGASAGIGRAAAVAFARRGDRVALLARGTDGLAGAERDVVHAGGTALAIPTDVADVDQVEAAADRVEREWGPIDIWVNNAMATIFSPFLDIAPEDFRRATEVTYLGAVWGTRAALKRMRSRDRGVIVQVGSALSYRSIPLQSAYCGAKSGLRGFTDSLRAELIHDKSRVRLTAVLLSGFNTPQFDWAKTTLNRQPQPVGTIYQPEVAADAIVFAAEHDRRLIYVGLPALEAVIGNKFLAGFLDWLMARRAYEQQFADQRLPAGRRDNLWQPVPADRGAHGRFDSVAKPHSWQLAATKHRGAVTLGMLGALGILAWFAGAIAATSCQRRPPTARSGRRPGKP